MRPEPPVSTGGQLARLNGDRKGTKRRHNRRPVFPEPLRVLMLTEYVL